MNIIYINSSSTVENLWNCGKLLLDIMDGVPLYLSKIIFRSIWMVCSTSLQSNLLAKVCLPLADAFTLLTALCITPFFGYMLIPQGCTRISPVEPYPYSPSGGEL